MQHYRPLLGQTQFADGIRAGLVARYLAEGRNKQASFFVRLAQSTNCKLRIKVITTNE